MGASTLGSRAIIGTFFNKLEAAMGTSWVDKISMLFTSDQASETYPWLGMAPAMREWIGPRLAHMLRENGLSISNKKFEATLDISLDDIRRDKTQQIDTRIGELAVRAVEHWAKLLSTFIANGTGSTSGLCYDGQYFFDSDHSEGASGSQYNLLTASQVTALNVTTAAAPTAAEAMAAVLGVISYMLTYKDDQGEPINDGARKFLVMTSPYLMSPFAACLTGKTLNTGSGSIDNTIFGLKEIDGFEIGLAVNSRLTWTDVFAVFRIDGQTKPLIRQEEVALQMTSKAEGSDYEHDNDAWQFGAKAVRNVGYGMWQQAAHATLS